MNVKNLVDEDGGYRNFGGCLPVVGYSRKFFLKPKRQLFVQREKRSLPKKMKNMCEGTVNVSD